ncbi:hypothetical protein [Parapedobacter tibetensis]|uniref:hypothetical protein n=1 Tax=Parapedobacter tibetensis TaxID=2972951 RepID=UPI00214DB0CF|nr:hypothetical protein [Parapedobacter tibetensis]
MDKNKIITSALDSFYETKTPSFLHLDEIYPKNELMSKGQLFVNGISLFNEIVHLCVERRMLDCMIDLQIELESNSTNIVRVPNDEQSLISMVDTLSMPEITVSVCKTPIWPPKIELYIAPLPFKISNMLDGGFALYEEYRTLEELVSNMEYSRWLTLSFEQNKPD